MTLIESVQEWFTSETARNKNASILSGLFFFTGWWLLIDSLSVYPGTISTGEAFIGVFSTLSFFMVNSVKNSHLSEDTVSLNRARAARAWILVGFVIGFSSIVAAIWVMIDHYISRANVPNWPGVALLLENVFILIGSLVYKIGRNEEDWSY